MPARDARPAAASALRASVRESGSELHPSQAGEARAEGVEVQPGDTASEIALVHLPAEISLDQMLVALLRRNPEVFVGGNVNRLPAGAILKIPDASMAAAIPLAEARRIVAEQNREYEAFRAALARRFRVPSDGRSNRVEVFDSSLEAEAARPRNSGDASGSLNPSAQPVHTVPDALTWKASGELTGGGIAEKTLASTVVPQASAMAQAASPAQEPSPPLPPEPSHSPVAVHVDRSPQSQFFGPWSWVLVFGVLAVAWGWFRSKWKAQPTVLQERSEVYQEASAKSESQPNPAPIPVPEKPTVTSAPTMPSGSAPDESKPPASSPSPLPPAPSLKPAGGLNHAPRTAAEPRRAPIPKPVDAKDSSLPEPGRRQRLQEEAELARLMAALKKEQAYQSDREQALEIRLRRLAGLIEENERRNRKEGFASRSYRWLLMALAEPGLKDNDPQRDLKLRLLIEIRDFNRQVQGRVAPVTQFP